jgi:hypothetical protein
MDLLPYPQRSERESIAADARHVIGMTPEERVEVFVGLERTMEAILAHLPPEDRRRHEFLGRAPHDNCSSRSYHCSTRS